MRARVFFADHGCLSLPVLKMCTGQYNHPTVPPAVPHDPNLYLSHRGGFVFAQAALLHSSSFQLHVSSRIIQKSFEHKQMSGWHEYGEYGVSK